MNFHVPISSRAEHGGTHSPESGPLELWGGPECTVNRVGDSYRDQMVETGHDKRLSDLDLISELGIKALRMPILWERIAPENALQRLWQWSDERIKRMRELGIRPIAGLLHHGSGPLYTSLLDDDFPTKFAEYALSVAQRYPDITDWTPVNEPLTTARFSALYGHWYPHKTDERSFWHALVNQIDATRQAMRMVRTVNPHARLIQTDDLGRTYATEPLAMQAEHDNIRRWAGWDLLCGMVVPGHRLWKRLVRNGLQERLVSLAHDPCPPDIIGINHYLTSDRFLDHRLDRYPPATHGGNKWQAFADIEAIRVLDPAPDGLTVALREAWERYHIPIAITEVHLGCTREEQMRWMRDAWTTAQQLRESGHDIRAVTAWALFGNRGWNTLLTAPGVYEPGVFDVSSGTPRKTALVDLISQLGETQEPHPASESSGWWRRDIRWLHPAVPHRSLYPDQRVRQSNTTPPILVLGATGTLGKAVHWSCRHRNLKALLTSRDEMNLCDERSIAEMLDRIGPSAVINAAGWVRVDDAEDDSDGCYAANSMGAIALSRLCDERGIATVNFSSDLVFGDECTNPRCESDSVNPMGVYGESKARMEAAVRELEGSHLIVRTAAFFSPFDDHNFAVRAAWSLGEGTPFRAADDQIVSPTYVPDLCNAVLDLLLDGEEGIWHLSNGAPVSWADFARLLANECGLDPELVVAVSAHELGWRAARPSNCALESERGSPMPSLASAVEKFGEIINQSARMKEACAI